MRACRPLALLGAGLFFAADLGVWHFSILYTSVANSTLLANLAPIFVTLARLALLEAEGHARVPRRHGRSRSAACSCSSAPTSRPAARACWAMPSARSPACSTPATCSPSRRPATRGASTARLMAWSTTITALVLLPIALLAPQPFWPSSANGWLVLLGLALVSQILGQGLIAYAFAHLPASLVFGEPADPAGDGRALRVGALRRGHRRRCSSSAGRSCSRASGCRNAAARERKLSQKAAHTPGGNHGSPARPLRGGCRCRFRLHRRLVPGAALPEQDHPHDRAVPARGIDGPLRARRRRQARPAPGTDGGDREQARRGRQHRRRRRGEGAGRRLHALRGHRRHERDQQGALLEDAVRPPEGFRVRSSCCRRRPTCWSCTRTCR